MLDYLLRVHIKLLADGSFSIFQSRLLVEGIRQLYKARALREYRIFCALRNVS